MPKVSEIFFGKQGRIRKPRTQTPEQEELNNLIIQGLKEGTGPFADLLGKFNEEEFNKGVSQPIMKQFTEEILPQLQNKFIGGDVGSVRGSGFRNALTKAGTDLQSKLAQIRYQAQQQQQANRMTGVNTALGNRSFENVYKPGFKGVVQESLQGAGPEAAKLATAAIAG